MKNRSQHRILFLKNDGRQIPIGYIIFLAPADYFLLYLEIIVLSFHS